MADALASAKLNLLVNHVFLPPKLPGGEDTKEWEDVLCKLLLNSLRRFQEFADESDRPCLDLAASSVKHFTSVNNVNGHISEPELIEALGWPEGQSTFYSRVMFSSQC